MPGPRISAKDGAASARLPAGTRDAGKSSTSTRLRMPQAYHSSPMLTNPRSSEAGAKTPAKPDTGVNCHARAYSRAFEPAPRKKLAEILTAPMRRISDYHARIYVTRRLEGCSGRKASLEAGFAPTTKVKDIEAGHKVYRLARDVWSALGIDHETLAANYKALWWNSLYDEDGRRIQPLYKLLWEIASKEYRRQILNGWLDAAAEKKIRQEEAALADHMKRRLDRIFRRAGL